MTEMTARVRNRLQDGMINWQERRFRNTDFRQTGKVPLLYKPQEGLPPGLHSVP